MAQEEERIKITFDTNAKQAAQDTNKLGASIENVTDATNENAESYKKQTEQVKSYKQQIREAIIEQQKLAQQYGATSEQAINAAKKVANLTDEMQFQKDLAKSYNPDEKFRALTQTAGLAALALGGVKDGLSALGIESKVLDQIIGSAQAILGVTSAVSGMTDAYELLTAAKKAKSAADVVETVTTEAVTVAEVEATAATWSWNAALLANPIVAITAGIVAAGAAIYAYIKITGDAVKAEEKAKVASMQLNVAIDNQARAFENNSTFLSKLNNHKAALLKASGASEAQIYKETKALAEHELQLAKNYRAEALILEQRAYEANRDNPTEFTAKALENAKENLKKSMQAVSVGYDGLIALQQEHEVAVLQAQTDARKKQEEAEEKAREERLRKLKESRDKELEALKAFNDETLKQIQAFNLARYQAETQARIDDENARYERLAIISAEVDAIEDQKLKDEETRAKLREEINNRSKDNAEKLLAFAASGAIKNKAIQKAAIVAEGGVAVGRTVKNTAEAIAQDLKLGFPLNIAPIALDAAVGATSIASIVSGTNKALQAVGGGSISGASINRTSQSTTPQVAFNNTAENQIGQSLAKAQADQPPLQVFVKESDITKAQNNVQVLVKTNTI